MGLLTVDNLELGKVGSIDTIVNLSKPRDTIKFNVQGNITLGRQLHIKHSLLIDGENKVCLIGTQRIFYISDSKPKSREAKGVQVTIKNLTLSSGVIENDRGGAVELLSNGRLILQDVVIERCKSKAGAVSARSNCYVQVLRCKFIENKTINQNIESIVGSPTAGAINVLHESKLTVKDSVFERNIGVMGGAIGSLFSTVIVEGSTFKYNSSMQFGGAMYIDGCSHPTKQDMLPTAQAVDIAIPGKFSLKSTIIKNNTSKMYGGGVAFWGYEQDELYIRNTSFFENRCIRDKNSKAVGGAIFINCGAKNKIEGSTILGNYSDDVGGAIAYRGRKHFIIDRSLISDNLAVQGAVLFAESWENNEPIIISNGNMSGNTATNGDLLYLTRPDQQLIIKNNSVA